MEVYIEYVVIDNIIINYTLLSVCSKVSGQMVARKNLIFASLFGALMVIFMPIMTTNEALLMIYRLVVGVMITLSVRKYSCVKQWFSYFLLFVSLTFLFGGMLIAMLTMFDIVYTTSGLLFLGLEIPISIFVVPIWIYAYLTIKVYRYIAAKVKNRQLYYDIAIHLGDKKYAMKAFLDTGNNLLDTDGSPCMVMELKTFCKIFNRFPLHRMLLGRVDVDELPYAHYIDVSTVNANERLLVFRADAVEITGLDTKAEYSNVSIAVSRKNFADYSLILHKNFC